MKNRRAAVLFYLNCPASLFSGCIYSEVSEAWPGDVPRDMLVARAFGAKLADESHRARLRVEVGRLRTVLRTLAGMSAFMPKLG